MAAKRIYWIKESIPGQTAEAPAVVRHHLVRAVSQSAAVKFIAEPRFTVELPSQDDLVAHLTNGVRVVDDGASE